MPWAKGQSGNPIGRVPGEKQFAEALRLALKRCDKKTNTPALNRIATRLVNCALKGEPWAIMHVADRLDGKPAQETMLTHMKHDAADWTREELLALLAEQAKIVDAVPADDQALIENRS